ncbi:hypothetical protein GCM10022229_21760 [Luteimonas lutimaris]|uniref:Type VI secretion system tip protein VgrG n=1 Tax=Luteimonas lutimaris TaxID=698645 RepID=A0ABP7MRY0_9GAMM
MPWTWLLTQGRHSRVFQDRSVVGIVEAVFADYAPLAAWQLGDEVGPFLGERERSYCVQYRESDFDFVSRLLAEEGLGWRLEEDPEAAAGHRLVLFADSAAQPEDVLSAGGGGIRFHRSDATESADSLQAFGRRQRIGADRLTVLGHDYKTVRANTAQLPLQAEEGLGWRLEEDPESAVRHRLVLFADSAAQPEDVRSAGDSVFDFRSLPTSRAQGARQ